MLLGENERKVLLAFANQTDIYTIARLMSVNESTVLVILESAITKLNKQSHSWIHNLASKYEDSCYRNQLLTAQLERYTKVVDLYKQIVKVYKDTKTRSHTDNFGENNVKCLIAKGICRFVPHSSAGGF